jgi:integrase
MVLDNTKTSFGPVTRNRARASLSTFWTWLIEEELAETNPVQGIKNLPEESRDRVLTPEELAMVWRSIDTNPFSEIVRLLILTAQRRNEIAHLRWTEVAGDRIELPRERVKNKQPHTVPLSTQAQAIIRRQPHRGEYVFGANLFRNWGKPKVLLDARLGLAKPWTLHDLRRTAVTGMAELGVQPHIIEAAINHKSGHKAGVAGIYNRATYANEVRSALELWANYIDGLTGAATISEAGLRLVHHD